ncbi:hypothetical protein V2J09_015572 [Rumex salicifolius]
MGRAKDSAAGKVSDTVRSHAANAAAMATDACSKLCDSTATTAAKVKETVAGATKYLSHPKSRDNLSKFAVNASIHAAKFIPGGVGTAVDIVSQSIPDNKRHRDGDEYIKRIEALEDEVKKLREEKKELKHSATSKL